MGKNALVVLGGARLDSLGHHLRDVAINELEELSAATRCHDLLKDGFDPVLRLEAGQAHARACGDEDPLVRRYQEDVRWADVFLIIHPVWWFAPPAILKGWVDRVLVHDVAIRQRPGQAPKGLLEGRRALVVQTFNCKRMVDRVVMSGISGTFWRRAVFLSTGVRMQRRLAFHGVDSVSEEELRVFELKLRRAVRSFLR